VHFGNRELVSRIAAKLGQGAASCAASATATHPAEPLGFLGNAATESMKSDPVYTELLNTLQYETPIVNSLEELKQVLTVSGVPSRPGKDSFPGNSPAGVSSYMSMRSFDPTSQSDNELEESEGSVVRNGGRLEVRKVVIPPFLCTHHENFHADELLAIGFLKVQCYLPIRLWMPIKIQSNGE